jgi:hypothetical protein
MSRPALVGYQRRDAQAATKSALRPAVQRRVHPRSALNRRPPSALAALTPSTISPPTPTAARAVAIARMTVWSTSPPDIGGLSLDAVGESALDLRSRVAGHVDGAHELDPPDEVEPPRPPPWRCVDHVKRRAARMLDRVGWMPVQRHWAGPEVPN